MLVAAIAIAAQQVSIPELGVVVFSKTAGFRHESIAKGKEMFQKLAEQNAWILTVTEDANELVNTLPTKKVAVFLSTTGDVLNDDQQKAFEAWYKKGTALLDLKQPERATEAFEFVVKNYPESVAAGLARQQLARQKRP